MADGYKSALLVGLAELVHAAGIAVWRPDGDYDPGQRGIWMMSLPPTDGEGIAIAPYLDLPGKLATNATAVQFLTRGTKNATVGLDVTDELRDLLHRRKHVTVGGIRIDLITQTSFGPLGKDANGRHEFAQNFSLLGMRGRRV